MLLFLESIGTFEVIVIMLVILMFFGSKSIPGISRTLGKTMREVRDATQGIKDEISKSTNDMKGEIQKTKASFENKIDLSKEVNDFKKSIKESETTEELKKIKSDLDSEIKTTSKTKFSAPEESVKT